MDPDNSYALNELGRVTLQRKDRIGAAGLFADSARSDSRDGIAASNVEYSMDLILRHTLRWALPVGLLYLLLLVVVPGGAGVVLGLLLGLGLVVATGRTVRGLRSATRGAFGRYLTRLPGHDRSLVLAYAAIGLGLAGIIVGCASPPGAVRIWSAVTGVGFLLVCRLFTGPVLHSRL